MSFEALGYVTGHVLVKGCALSPVERLTLISIAATADVHGEGSFPGLEYLSETTGASERTIQRSLEVLTTSGVIEDTGERRGRTARVVVWRMLLPEGAPKVAWPKHWQWRQGVVIQAEAAEGSMATPVRDSPASNDDIVSGLNDDIVSGLEPANDDIDDNQSRHRRQVALSIGNQSGNQKTDPSLRSGSAAGFSAAAIRSLVVLPAKQQSIRMEDVGWVESPDTPWLFTKPGHRPFDLLVAALIEVRGIVRADVTDQEWPRFGRAAQMLRKVGADPLEVVRRGGRFGRKRGFRPTPITLASSWSEWGDAADDRFSRGDARHAEALERARRVAS